MIYNNLLGYNKIYIKYHLYYIVKINNNLDAKDFGFQKCQVSRRNLEWVN